MYNLTGTTLQTMTRLHSFRTLHNNEFVFLDMRLLFAEPSKSMQEAMCHHCSYLMSTSAVVSPFSVVVTSPCSGFAASLAVPWSCDDSMLRSLLSGLLLSLGINPPDDFVSGFFSSPETELLLQLRTVLLSAVASELDCDLCRLLRRSARSLQPRRSSPSADTNLIKLDCNIVLR